MTLSAGSRLGPYEILSPLGAGGMGEVFRAHDTRLKRDVAVKVLPSAYAADGERLRRFEQEAQSASALNHPNILSIFDFGEHEGAPYMVSELLEGETLRSRLAGGAFAPRRAIAIALQVAHGLAAAHEKGIVHRDLKPENLFLTADGRVKILDFGLAKLTQPDGSVSSQTNLPTEAPGTEPGVVLGTLGYMSPEQVRGKGADARSDLFSFGAILYEMLSGHRAFQGDTAADTISAILTRDPPDLSETNRRVPESLDRIVRHCLEKTPEARFHSASDIAFDLEAISGASLSTPATAAPAAMPISMRLRRLAPWLALPAIVLGYLLGRGPAGSKSGPVGSQVATVRKLTMQSGVESFPSLSPDGATVVYQAGPRRHTDLFLQRVGGHNPINLTKDCAEADAQPSFSPSGERIAYRSECGGGGIFVMGATGENLRRVSDVGYYPSWSPDEKEIAVSTESFEDPYSRSGISKLIAVRADSGEKRVVAESIDCIQPAWSPHGNRIACWGLKGNTGQRDIWTVPAAGEKAGPAVDVTHDPATDWNPFWSPDGRFVYFASDRGGSVNLWKVAIDERSGKTLSVPEAVTVPANWAGPMSVARDGKHVVYQSLTLLPSIEKTPFDPVAERPSGTSQAIFQSSMPMLGFEVSRDGQWIAFASGGSRMDIFLMRSDGTGLRQLTDDAYKDRNVGWSPDGQRLYFMSDRSGSYETWSIRPDGGGLEQVTHNSKRGVWWPVFSPDGTTFASPNGFNSFFFHLDAASRVSGPEPFPELGADGWFDVFDWSRDGRRLVGGRGRGNEQFGVVLYDVAAKRYERLNERGWMPRFLPDGRRILFSDLAAVWLIDAASKKEHVVLPAEGEQDLVWFNVAPDGRAIYTLRQLIESDIWLAELK
ncbi:MAG: protein kinase domain-containing protein [Syntrophomonadaceae bacterium]